jgi:hypothetical protein
MKNVIAFILTVIYAVFITGSVCATQVTGDYTFSESLAGSIQNDDVQEPAKISFSKDFGLVHLGKVVKHLAVGGKTKVPRAGYSPVIFTNFISNINSYYNRLAITVEEPELYPHPIFLKNSVLRI